MTTQLDASVAFGLETLYGTAVAPTRAYEFTDESLEWQPSFVQGVGLRAGSRMHRAARRGLGKQAAGGDFTVECVSKGFGFLWNAALGASTSTMISAGPAYQQNHSVLLQDYLPSYTIQKGIPLLGSATVKPHTFAGAQCKSFELSISTGGILTMKQSYMAKSIDTTVATYTAPVYPATPQLFTFTGGAITIGGTVTAPTATALATGGTAVADIRDWSLSWDNKLDEAGYTFGNSGMRGRPGALGLASGSGKITAEFDSAVLRDAYLNQTDLGMVMNFVCPVAITGAVFPTISVYIPDIRLEGEIPKASNSNGDVITQSISYTILDSLVSSGPLVVSCITPDTAI